MDTGRVKVPFGIAQIGKAFRNEITPRNFIFRSREFEQMEIEYFIPPGEEQWRRYHREWIDTRKAWFGSIGLTKDFLGEEIHPKEKLAHYAQACTDITFKFPFGEHELEGIAARGNFDLSQHQEHSGKNLEYFDEALKAKYLPNVIEPSLGVDRTFLAVLCSAYQIDEIEGENELSFGSIRGLPQSRPEYSRSSKTSPSWLSGRKVSIIACKGSGTFFTIRAEP